MNKSGEIDVFQAERYFSGYPNSSFSQKILREERGWRGERISSDMATRNIHLPRMENQTKEKIKYKQPSSPGGRISSFLNSLFNQSSSKKKMKASSTMAVKEEKEITVKAKKRRSSCSHFRSYITMDSNSIYSSSSPIKTLKDGFVKQPLEKKELRKMEVDDDDDGEDSDSSSDLFELKIYDFYSTDLPVYESTTMEKLKR